MGELRRLELASRDLINKAVASAAGGGVDGADATPETYVLVVATANSPANQMFPPERRVPEGNIGVSIAERGSVSRIVTAAVGQEIGEQITRPHPCGHWWALLSTEKTSRFCCTVCDLKVVQTS